MIALSPTMEEGTILKWNKSVGDTIDTGDVVCEVETDKASMDYESTQEGKLLKIIKNEGEGARVGETIGILGEEGEDIEDILKEVEQEGKAASSDSGESKEEASDQSGSQSSTQSGGQSGDQSGQSPAPSGSSAATSGGAAPSAPAGQAAGGQPSHTASGKIKASPLALKLAAQKGIDINTVAGSGPGGRIIKRDIENYKGPAPSAAAGAAAAPAASSFAPVQNAGEDREIPVAGKRAAIAKKVANTKFSAPHFYIKNSVAMDNLIAARGMLNKEAPQKVSFNAFIMKFAAEALKRHPGVNASWQGDKILQYGSIDIALAVDLGNGLMMPVVRNVGNKGVVQIDAELKELIQKVKDGTLKPEEYTGATFSISNLGSFGVDEFTAILNDPGAAILALGKVNKVPVFDEQGNVKPESQMKMTLSCDHRVIDGSMGGRFLTEMQRMMENPVRVLF
ncbi:Dihydrolipoamide acetyltransferase component of pyruvate dehydrogenase complex [Salinispira pacifica]|uniref:Dihydrolipoamide acetyltransferase component of pyruvate dehydrogenase complex n=2 Tax=Salinispira pacifica TaxID=1307761 RepID=V5WIV4_9SPIO|nr:Dihydrolipoamide acetyltransferase component of pyruvate dehydrogenase complex [Salinispira pacifica]